MTLESIESVEELLEEPDKAPYYDLLGGLADNLMTVGNYAGTFLECSDCGKTFSLKGESWKCEHCGNTYDLKFHWDIKNSEHAFQTKVKVSNLTKPRTAPHWYYENENWSVAEFLTQILRLQPESFLNPWFNYLGVSIDPISTLETVLCWPRFKFSDKKTLQPDLAVAFDREIVLVEFKRPKGGTTPPDEILRQMCFSLVASRKLKRRWHMVLIPGSDSIAKRSNAEDYVQAALGALDRAELNGIIPQEILDEMSSTSPGELSKHIVVIGWESLLRLSMQFIQTNIPASWSQKQVLKKLRYFHDKRVDLNLLKPLT